MPFFQKISEPKIDRDSSSPTNSMRSTSPDLKVFWPQQTKNKTELYHQLQLQQQLKLKQQHLLTPGMMNTIIRFILEGQTYNIIEIEMSHNLLVIIPMTD